MIKLDLNPPADQLRQFGWISLLGFPAVGGALVLIQGLPLTVLWVLAGVGVVVFLLSRINVQLVRPVFVTLMLVALPIGFVLSFVLMGLVYFGLFTPVGLLFRLTGRDTMHKHPDPKAQSYWHERGAPRPPASYYKLY